MRTALRAKTSPRAQVATPYPRRAPVKGWMVSENIVDMPEDSAYVLDNWFPETNSIRIRNGTQEHATLPDDSKPVPAILVHEAGGVTTVFGSQDGNIYNVTAGGSVSVTAVTGQTEDRYVSINFATSGGNFLVACNGTDDVLNYDGSSWTTPAITNVASDDLNYVFSYKSRLFFLENSTADAWALPVDSIAGAAIQVAIGGELTLGGTLIAGTSLLITSASGPDDYCVFLSSEGEVVMYAGDDPSDPNAWALKGKFRIGRPIGNKCMLQIGGDVAVLCADGVVSLLRAVQLDRAAQSKSAFTSNIRKAFADQYALTGGLAGWELLSWPTAHMAIVNVPTVANSQTQQYVMNVLTGAWARFTNLNIAAFGLASTTMYYGTYDGRVMKFGVGAADDGEPVNATAILSFSPQGAAGRLKHAKTAQVFLKATGDFAVGINIASDFNVVTTSIANSAFSPGSGARWDVAVWDVDVWPEQVQQVLMAWLGVSAVGYYLAPVILGQTGAESTDAVDCQFISCNVLTEAGAVLG